MTYQVKLRTIFDPTMDRPGGTEITGIITNVNQIAAGTEYIIFFDADQKVVALYPRIRVTEVTRREPVS